VTEGAALGVLLAAQLDYLRVADRQFHVALVHLVLRGRGLRQQQAAGERDNAQRRRR
jgi:hypothetical protein